MLTSISEALSFRCACFYIAILFLGCLVFNICDCFDKATCV